MKPVKQQGHDDCLRAAIASLLELEIDKVPHFMSYGKYAWTGVLTRFIALAGFDCWGCVNADSLRVNDAYKGHFLASVPAKITPNLNHAVVIDTTGLVVHDPITREDKSWQGINIIESGDINHCYVIMPKKILDKTMKKWEQKLKGGDA